MLYFLLALSAVAPSFLLVWYFQVRDLRPERARVIWATFGLGILIILPVLLWSWPFLSWIDRMEDPYIRAVCEAFLTAAIPEETMKFLIVSLFVMRLRDFDEPMDGVVYAAIASLGFATFENITFVSDPKEGGLTLALGRALTSVPAHASFGAIMGYFVGQARFSKSKSKGFFVAALLVPMVLHGLYDFPILCAKALTLLRVRFEVVTSLAEENFLLFGLVPTLLLSVSWAIYSVRTLRKDQIDQANIIGDLDDLYVSDRRKAKNFLLLVLGGMLVSAAGMVVFGLVASVLSLRRTAQPIWGLGFVETLLLAVLSAAGGSLLFYIGIKKLSARAIVRPMAASSSLSGQT